MALHFPSRSAIGVVELFGPIGVGVRVPTYSRILDGLRKDRRFKAVIVEVDSPGGTAAGSELLYRGLARVAQEKPVVAYIRGTGASGAYYIACAAHKIVSIPSALVGSIGVIYVRPILEQMLQKLGISFSVYTGGRLKDMTGFWRSPSSEEEAKFRGLIQEIYDIFVGVVAASRGLDREAVEELATGEVFTGAGAKDRGLVDEMGDFDTALDIAADLGRVRRKPSWVRPPRPVMDRLVGRMGGPLVGEGLVAGLEQALGGGLYYAMPPYGLGQGYSGEAR